MAPRLATAYLVCLLVGGCASKPTVQQDITLAAADVSGTVKAAPARNSARIPQDNSARIPQDNVAPTAAPAVMSGSGAATNIVSDPSLDISRAGTVRAQAAEASPVAIPSPVRQPTRLASAVMIEPVSAATNGRDQASDSASGNNESSSSVGAVSTSDAARADKKIASKVLTLKRTKPDCKGAECPVLNFKRLTFTGYDRFNSFLEQTLLSLALVETNRDKAFRDLPELELYFFKTAKPREEIALASSVKYMSEEVVVVQLDSYIFTGGAHGISTTQYLNWLPRTDKLLTLESMLLPGKMPAFDEALKKQHALWLKKNPLAKEDPAAYNKLWPFESSDNVALLENGLAVTYDPYRLAPYSFGKPTIYIPYRDLKGILRPEVLPKG